MKISNYYYYYYVLLNLFGLPRFSVALAEPTQILLSEVVFPHNIWQVTPNNAPSYQLDRHPTLPLTSLFICLFLGSVWCKASWSLSCFCLWQSRYHPWEAGLRNGIKSGRGEMQMSSLARLSTVPPAPSKSSPLSLLLTVPSHYLSIFMPG